MSGTKIEIDLNNILGDEYGTETIQESIRRQVIENLTQTIKQGVGKQINEQISKAINEEIKLAIKEVMPKLIDHLLNAKYVMVNQWGESTGKETTMREELLKAIHENMKYQPQRYNNDKNFFTRGVDDLVEKNMNDFKEKFGKLVNDKFLSESLAHAVQKLKESLTI